MTITTIDGAPVTAVPEQIAAADDEHPDPEVPERAQRRTFTAKYKLEVLAAYDAAEAGAKGALLRREGLYSSHIAEWRRARDGGALAGLSAPRGRRRPDVRDATIARLTKEQARLEQELVRTRFVVDVQSKLQALLEQLSNSADPAPRSRR